MWQDRVFNFEVQTRLGKRWIADSTHGGRAAAMERARALVSGGRHTAVRVIREDQNLAEEIVFQEECGPPAERPLTIAAVEEAAFCDDIDDLLSFPARRTVGRLLRQYLDRHNLTAFELVHDYGHLRILARQESFLNQAIHRVAAIQSRAGHGAASQRVEALYGLVNRHMDRVREAERPDRFEPLLKAGGVPALADGVERELPAPDWTLMTGRVLAAHLGSARDWSRKVGRALDLLDKDAGAASLGAVDEMLADVLDGADGVRDLLGYRPDLGSVFSALARVAAGRYGGDAEREPALARLDGAMSVHDLPLTRQTLLERVARGVGGVQPLTRESDAADCDAFVTLLAELTGSGGLAGGPLVCEAVTRRARMAFGRDGSDLNAAEGIAKVLSQLPTGAVRLGYLLGLTGSAFGERYPREVLASLLDEVQGVSDLKALLPPGAGRDETANALVELRESLSASALPEDLAEAVTRRLDRLLSQAPEPKAKGKAAPAPAPEVTAAPATASGSDALPLKAFRAGDLIFREGDPGDEAYLIVSGRVDITLAANGDQTVLATLARGDILGEMALVDNRPRMASARATEDTTLTVIPEESFRRRLDRLAESDRLIRRLMDVFVERIRTLAQSQ